MSTSYAFGMHLSRRMHWSNAEERVESLDRRRVGVGYLPKQTRDKLNHKQNDLFETILLPELFLHCLCQFWIHESRSSIRADGSTKQQHIRLGPIPNVRTPLTTCTHSNAPSPGSSGSRVASTPAPPLWNQFGILLPYRHLSTSLLKEMRHGPVLVVFVVESFSIAFYNLLHLDSPSV